MLVGKHRRRGSVYALHEDDGVRKRLRRMRALSRQDGRGSARPLRRSSAARRRRGGRRNATGRWGNAAPAPAGLHVRRRQAGLRGEFRLSGELLLRPRLLPRIHSVITAAVSRPLAASAGAPIVTSCCFLHSRVVERPGSVLFYAKVIARLNESGGLRVPRPGKSSCRTNLCRAKCHRPHDSTVARIDV